MEKELILCSCGSVEHQLIISHDVVSETEPEFDDVYVSIHLSTYRGFWKRLVYAVKYIFGYKSRYGAFDEIILEPDDHEKLQTVVNRLIEIKTKRAEKAKQNEIRAKERESLPQQ